MFKIDERPHALAIPPEALNGVKNPTVYVT